MTVLRSRELHSSTPSPRTLGSEKKKPSICIEPSTPSQPPETSIFYSSPLYSTSSPVPAQLDHDSGCSRRRSLRLAFKLSSADDSVKKGLGLAELKVDRDRAVQMDSEVRDLDDDENAGCDLSESIREETKIDFMEDVACGMDSCSGIEVDPEEQVCVALENVRKGDETEPSGQKSSQSKGKRKVNVDIALPSLDAAEENEGSECFVSLRSGKKLMKKGTDGVYFGLRKAEYVEVTCDKGFKDIGERIGGERFSDQGLELVSGKLSLEKENVNENGKAKRGRSVGKGKKKVLETEDTELIKINRMEVDLKHGKGNLNADLNQSSSSAHGRQKSVVIDKGKRKLNPSEEGVVLGQMISNRSTGDNGTPKERRDFHIKEEELSEDLLRLLEGEDQRMMEEEEEEERIAIEEVGKKMEIDLRRITTNFRDVASRSASRFAHFNSDDEENNSSSGTSTEQDIEYWPGPFYTAMKIIKDREQNKQEAEHSVFNKCEAASVMWVPKKIFQNHSKPSVPSLKHLCLMILARNADSITSLDCIPDAFRHRLSQLLCDSRRMTIRFFELLLRGSPTEIRLTDCSWLTEEQFVKSFEGCDTSKLTVLQLDHSGRCMADYILPSTLARFLNSIPALTTLSLSGACRLSDVGLSALISSAPALKSVNLSQCSLLTSFSIETLANLLGSSLRELYLTDCQFLDATHILTALKKFEKLEVLSLAGIQTISDKFIKEFVTARGHDMKELFLTDCVKLTDSSLKVIAETCSGLYTLDIVNLCKLTDSSLGHLASGCRAINTLKLCRNAFSDESIAAYLEISGDSLEELSLNNIMKVGHNTALSLAKCAKKLVRLDISWCRNLSDEAVGLIVDSCSSLRVLKLFGCTQITNVFLEGHSNPNIKIIGCKMSPLLAHFDVPHFERSAGYSS